MRIFVTGGTGLVGSHVIKVAREQHHAEVIAALFGPPPSEQVDYHMHPLDLADHAAVRAAVRTYRPDAVIHCAALLDQQMMYRQRRVAWSIMVEGTRALAYACREAGARLVFVSSDWVFDGREPLVDEDSPPFPVNFYGVMKMASERELSMMDGLNYGIGRLAGVYGLNDALPSLTRWTQGVGFGDLANDYVDRFLKKQPVHVWTGAVNEMAHPTLASDGADMLLRLAQHDGSGIYHCFGREAISRDDLALKVAEVFEGDTALIQTVPLPEAARAEHENIPIPHRTIASTAKTAQALGREALDVREGLQVFKQQLEQLQA